MLDIGSCRTALKKGRMESIFFVKMLQNLVTIFQLLNLKNVDRYDLNIPKLFEQKFESQKICDIR